MRLKILNTVGLIIGIIGVIFIFIWGHPQPNLNAGFFINLENSTPIDTSAKLLLNIMKKYEQNLISMIAILT